MITTIIPPNSNIELHRPILILELKGNVLVRVVMHYIRNREETEEIY